ncbi:lipase family protein [Nocardiopsis dassonvillei]|uniref:hypothetical protein n=1 Tax=Nocardiopsis dassonvillei TaxID=2014 RepID=UPI00363B653E
MFLLVGPDRRDREVLLDHQVGRGNFGFRSVFLFAMRDLFTPGPEEQQMYRLGWRLLVLLVWTFAFISLVSVHPLALPVLILFLLAFLLSRYNVIQPVVTVAECDPDRETLLDYLEDRLDWLRGQCDEIVIIAHSQGGYLVHQLLARDGGRNQEKVVRLACIGSGLKPIWILRQTRDWRAALIMWLFPVASLSLTWGLIPILSPGLSAAASSLLVAVASLAVPLTVPIAAMEPMMMISVSQNMSEVWLWLVYTSPFFTVSEMTLARWVAVVLAVGLTCLGAWLMRRSALSHRRDTLELPVTNRCSGPLVWQEYSSHHDMVGRMLLPTLPKEVEQKAVPVVGHPLNDHTRYFDPQGILVRILAGSLLVDLERTTRRNFGADAWNEQIERYATALREQHDRRRRFHGLLMFGMSLFLVIPSLAEGDNIFRVLMEIWPWFAAVTMSLSFLFTWRSHRSHRQLIDALDSELRGDPEIKYRVRIMPPGKRKWPTLLLLAAALFAFSGSMGMFIIGRLHSHGEALSAGGMLLAAMVLAVLSAAVASGYRIKRRWLVAVMALATSSVVVAPVLTASAPTLTGLSGLVFVPGVSVAVAVALVTIGAAVRLTRSTPVPFPENDRLLAT